VPDTDYDLPGEVVKNSTIKLSKALPSKGASLLYSYDFGDNWAHSVVLEDIVLVAPETKYPRIVDGARACPPEDSGGPYGYADLLAILAKPRHKDHRQAETQRSSPNARMGWERLRSGEVLGESCQSSAETSPAEKPQTQERSDSVVRLPLVTAMLGLPQIGRTPDHS
jgi:hypothetical protein